MKSVIDELEKISLNSKMSESIEELKQIYQVMSANGYDKNINFDFSIVNDMGYYNGVVFQGFVEGIPTGILSGGRYDNLMQKMGKDAGAIGFAVSLDMLERLGTDEDKYDVDTILIYSDNEDIKKINEKVLELTDKGECVLALRNIPEKIKYRKLLKMKDGEAVEIESND